MWRPYVVLNPVLNYGSSGSAGTRAGKPRKFFATAWDNQTRDNILSLIKRLLSVVYMRSTFRQSHAVGDPRKIHSCTRQVSTSRTVWHAFCMGYRDVSILSRVG